MEDFSRIASETKKLLTDHKNEPRIDILITRDRMEAYIQISQPENGREVTIEELYQNLEQKGIRQGIDLIALKQAIERPGLKFPCAKGTPPQRGQDAVIEYLLCAENQGCPAEMENGRVDFKNLNLFTVVHAGDVLAEKIPLSAGVEGVDVLGLPLPASPGKDVPLIAGRNVVLEENGQKAVAKTDGQLLWEKNQVHVLPCLQIQGDVDLSTGNIDFVGSVIVNGNLTPGFTIKATGTVDIQGMVEGGSIYAEKIIVRHGIQGMNKGEIRSRGDIIAQFIENAHIFAGGSVLIHSVLLHSQVEAHHSIELKSPQSQIIGGRLHAAHTIVTYSAGRPRAALTELRAGVKPTLEEEERKLAWVLVEHKKQLEQMSKPLQMFNNTDYNSLSEERKQAKRKLESDHKRLTQEITELQSQIHEIEQELLRIRHGYVQVNGPAYPGVVISVGEASLQVKETIERARYIENGDHIQILPIFPDNPS